MAIVGDLLNQVWSEFRKIGISYDLAIIEHIAAFLLEINEQEFPDEELQPRKPNQPNLNTKKIKQLLIEATNTAGGTAKLLDRHVIFYLPNMLAGGGYPTPRHIAKNMISLAQVEANHSRADFDPKVGIKWVTDGKTRTGIICQGIDDNLEKITYKAFDEQTNQTYPSLLVELVAVSLQQLISVQIPLDFLKTSDSNEQLDTEEQAEAETDIDSEKPQAEKNVNQVIQLLSHQVKAVAISLTPQNQITGINQPRLLGVAVPKSAIHEQAYDLRPETYIRTQTESSSIESPTALLAKIYRNQRQLAQRIDSLFGHLESPPIATQKLPSPIQAEIKPLGKLSQEQIKIWEKVRDKTEAVNDNYVDNYNTAALFTLEELSTAGNEEVTDVTRSTIDLLERMGIIVAVTVADPKTNEPLSFYRRVTERDRWHLDSGASNSGEESK